MSNGFISHEELLRLRNDYPPGMKVCLVKMDDVYRQMPSGLKGIVKYVDDAGSIHVQWENGSTLAVVFGVDIVERI